MDKVQDRSEEVVITSEAHREHIMAKMLEVHTTSNIYGIGLSHRPLGDHRKRHRGHLHREKVRRPCNSSSKVGIHS
jgi:hypothetical protein